MDAPQENRRPSAAPPSLLGSGSPAAKKDELKILSALQAPSRPVARSSKWLPMSLGVLAMAGVAYAAWQYAPGSPAGLPLASAPQAAASAAAPALPASAVQVAVANVPPAAASAALIENVAAAAMPAAASAPAPAASASVSPLAVLAAAEPAASAADMPAPPVVKASKPAVRHADVHTVSAKPAKAPKKKPSTHEAPKASPGKDADVDLLEAMVAHVRGKNAASSGKAQPGAAAEPAKR